MKKKKNQSKAKKQSIDLCKNKEFAKALNVLNRYIDDKMKK